MSASSAIVTTVLLATTGENATRLRAPQANAAEQPKRLFADSLPLVKARSESGTDKVSADVVSEDGFPMMPVSRLMPEAQGVAAPEGNALAESMSPCPHDPSDGAAQTKGVVVVPLSAQVGQVPGDVAPAIPYVPADPAKNLKGQRRDEAGPKGGISTAQVPAPLAEGHSGVVSEGGNASAAPILSPLPEAQSDTTGKRDVSATPIPACRASQQGVPIPKEDAPASQISQLSGKAGDGAAVDEGFPKTVRPVVVSQAPADHPTPAGSPESPGEEEIAAAELASKPWSFGATAQVAGPGTMTYADPSPVAKAQIAGPDTVTCPNAVPGAEVVQSQAPWDPATLVGKAPASQPAERTTPRQVSTQDSSVPSRTGLREGSMQGPARQAIAPAVIVAEGASESAKNTPAPAPQATTAQVTAVCEHVGNAVSGEAPRMTADSIQPKIQSAATADPVQYGVSANPPETEDSNTSESVLPDSRDHGKLENMPALDKLITPARVAEPSLASRYLDNRYLNPSGREAVVRRIVSAGVNQTPGKGGDSSAVQASVRAVPQFSALEGIESAGVQRATAHIAAPVGAESGSIKTPAQSVGEQILDSIRGSISRGEQQLSIRLRPPELGSVCVRLTERNDQIHAVLEVDRPDTRREIERALPDVLQSLHDQGVPIKKLEVTTGETPQREPGREQLPQDSWQQGSNRSHDDPQHSGSAGRPVCYNSASQTVADSLEPAAVTPGGPADRIDMLM